MKTLLAAFVVSVAAILAGSACVTAAGLLAFALAAARVWAEVEEVGDE